MDGARESFRIVPFGTCLFYALFFWPFSRTPVAFLVILLVVSLTYIKVLERPGPWLFGLVSFECGLLMNIPFGWVFFSLERETPMLVSFGLASGYTIIFIVWLLSAACALRRRLPPDFRAAILSTSFLLSPGVLRYLAAMQNLLCSLLGVEWYNFRPFHWVEVFIWYQS